MKTKEQETISLTTYLPNQDTPFVITGVPELLDDMASDLQAQDERNKAQMQKVSASMVKQAVASSTELTGPIYVEQTKREKVAQYFADSKLRRFDREYGTNLYEEKRNQRRRQAIFLMAGEAGLFDRESDYYKSQLRRLSK